MTHIEDARDELGAALRYGVIADDITRDHVAKAYRILQQQCRLEHGAVIGTADLGHFVASADRGTAA